MKWDEAYVRFETPEEEIAKFRRRLQAIGAERWPKDARIVELFCGRGSGLHALASLGFTRVEGVDISPDLVALYRGPAKCLVADCRTLPFPDGSKDILIVQGGLHHLPSIETDLPRVLSEARRVLVKDTGLFFVVEPWKTPFLDAVHFLARQRWLQRIYPKLEAFDTMVRLEQPVYQRWLANPALVQECFARHFETVARSVGWGKTRFLGRPKLTDDRA